MYYLFIVERFASVWRANDKDVMKLSIPEDCTEFREYYDAVQEKISQISVLDELLAGMFTVQIILSYFHLRQFGLYIPYIHVTMV